MTKDIEEAEQAGAITTEPGLRKRDRDSFNESESGISNAEIRELLLQQKEFHQQIFSMKRILFILVALAVILALSNLGTTFAAVVLAKDTEVDDQGRLVDKDTKNIVVTESIVRAFNTKITNNGIDTSMVEDNTNDINYDRRALQEEAVTTSSYSAISKGDAGTLYENCAAGSATLKVTTTSGERTIVVCPGDSHSKEGSTLDDPTGAFTYTFEKSGKTLSISCPSAAISPEIVNDDISCLMTGSILTPVASEPLTILDAGYETGTLDSGIVGLVGTRATATDAASVSSTIARSGMHSICHKVVLDEDGYVSSGKPRSESDTLAILDTRYTPGTHYLYKFSIYLKDWEDWGGTFIPVDIIWQFKHTQGGPDGFFGIKRNNLIFSYGSKTRGLNSQTTIIDDIRPYDNQWIDIEVEVKWEETDTGFFRIRRAAPAGTDMMEVLFRDNFPTFRDDATGAFGYLKWGLYRPDSTATNNAITREIYHDDMVIVKL